MQHSHKRPIPFAVLTSSDSVARGTREDAGGQAVVDAMNALGHQCIDRHVASDDVDPLFRKLRQWADDPRINLVLTTGGTGLGPRDVTPEATARVISYEIPGITEAMRFETLGKTRMAMLSRAVAGVGNRTLIVNLPGSPKGVAECIEVIGGVLPHAVDVISGADRGEHPN